MGLQFYETVRGANFFDHEVPALIKSINRLAAAIEESNRFQQEAAAKTVATPAKQAETYFCYTSYNHTKTYTVTTFCRSARETIIWANTQVQSAIEEGFELVNPFTAEREFFGAIADAKSARIELKHPDGRVRYIGFERE